MTQFKKIVAPLVASLSLAMAMPASAAELVTNGGFETGNFSGWTQGGNTDFTSVTAGAANASAFGARLGPIGSVGTLTQTLSTVAGNNYILSFDLKNTGGTPNFFNVLFNGVSVFSLPDSSSFPSTYRTFSGFQSAAASNSSTLQFVFSQDPGFWNLDNVSVQNLFSVVPETTTWALLLFGFAVAGLSMRARSRRVTSGASFV